MQKLLTIGLATFDDYDGVFFTIQSIRMHHGLNLDEIEFIVLDNNPNSNHGKEVKKFIENQAKGTYIPFSDKPTSFAKYEILKYATGKYYIGLDCHILLLPNTIQSILSYFNKNIDCKNLIQGPLIYDDLKNISTHFEPGWSGGMYGKWQTDKDAFDLGVPFEILMNGMGMFSCEVKNWPKINENFKGFGGEEWYIHEKIRANGGKVICIPQAQWMHRFARPNGIPFINTWEDRVRNYYIGWLELYHHPSHPMVASIKDHFISFISEEKINNILKEIIEL